jgi:hypothetical protein
MTDAKSPTNVTIYTVGHGRHPWADFLALLKQYEIEVLCDVRSAARSRWPQFNGQVLAASLNRAGLGYEWLPECGGKVVAAVRTTSAQPVVLMPTLGGSLPLSLIRETLGAPTITVPVANYDNNQHAENENILLQNFWDGIETWAAIMTMKN